MADFQKAFQRTMGNEGGYVNDPADKGGETYRGISRRFFPSWPGWENIDSLKKQPGGFPGNAPLAPGLSLQVSEFYKVNFWDRILGDAIAVQEVAEELFDDAVNMGIDPAVKFLQEAICLLNRNGAIQADLAIDGKLGLGTLSAMGKILTENNGLRHLLLCINGLQLEYYFNICRRNPSQEKFLRGWIERTV